MPRSPVRQYAEQLIADQIDDLMADIGKIENRSTALNLVMGILASLSALLRANNLKGLRNLVNLCDRELTSMRDR